MRIIREAGSIIMELSREAIEWWLLPAGLWLAVALTCGALALQKHSSAGARYVVMVL